MKRLLSIFFLLLYINAAFAIGTDTHFCNGKITGKAFLGFGKANCSCPEKAMPEGCCRNEANFTKSDSHKTPVQPAQPPSPATLKWESFWNSFLLLFPSAVDPDDDFAFYQFIRSKPSRTLLVLNQIFRI